MSRKRNALVLPLFLVGTVAFSQVTDPGSYSSSSRNSRSSFGSNSNSNNNGYNNQNNSNQNNTNNSTTNQQNKGKATPTPKPGATPSHGMTSTKPTSGTRTAASAPGSAPAKGPAGKGGASATGAAWTGAIKEVTHGMVDAIKTRKVEYDPAEAADDPALIILNAPKYKADENSITIKAGKSDDKEGDSIVHPL